MDAETLSREFRKSIAFVGGVDTQDLLVNATAQQRIKLQAKSPHYSDNYKIHIR
jgi:hypothetical protein